MSIVLLGTVSIARIKLDFTYILDSSRYYLRYIVIAFISKYYFTISKIRFLALFTRETNKALPYIIS